MLLGGHTLAQVGILKRSQISHLLRHHLVVGDGKKFAIRKLLLKFAARIYPLAQLLCRQNFDRVGREALLFGFKPICSALSDSSSWSSLDFLLW